MGKQYYNCSNPILQNPGPRHLVYCSCEMKQEHLVPTTLKQKLTISASNSSKEYVQYILKPVQNF